MNIVALKSNRKEYYSIFHFINMTEVERDNYRDNIVCMECGVDAYYRKPTKDGKIACFGAKHIDGCGMSSGNKNKSLDGDKETNEIDIQTSEFDIRWNYINSSDVTKKAEVENQDEAVIKNTRKYTKKPSIEKNIKISLNQILEFAELDIIKDQEFSVNINNKNLLLKDIVMNIEEINDNSIDKDMFFWGNISSFNGDYINTVYRNKVSIIIDKSISLKFWKTYRNRILKIIKNNSVIIFGKAKKSQKGNYYILLNDIKTFYIKNARKNN
ncbi:hypothetical protein [Clostridium beijerinckii]|uniref:Uncharacterized protein n=1 Tax=Clostridium beijerinckii TaxID=1520 RepID=A0AAX0B8U3_CLOBE|nr:hypothetical protein [Clostridium beijerinckii]NRT90894.1 hypothetical protein [Clostridium beijerinckii]NYC70420.1 hypothetical protein [Clostridium beijerinckii]